jgi:ribosomal protein L44E
MPTQPKKHRTYCKSCQDFTIHSRELLKAYLTCETCDKVQNGYTISEVDPNLIKIQRERYKKSRKQKIGGMYGAFLGGVGIQAIMDLDEIIVVECDAGQEEIDEQIKQIRTEKVRKFQAIKDEFNQKYSKLGRNETCSCGSGKKFKKCHLPIFREKGIKF